MILLPSNPPFGGLKENKILERILSPPFGGFRGWIILYRTAFLSGLVVAEVFSFLLLIQV
jgi:hypothetical protein